MLFHNQESYTNLHLVKHLAPKILMAVNYCEHQLGRRLGWSAPAGQPAALKHTLQYDSRLD